MVVYDDISGIPENTEKTGTVSASVAGRNGSRTSAGHVPGGESNGLANSGRNIGAGGRGLSSAAGDVLPGRQFVPGNRGGAANPDGHGDVAHLARSSATAGTFAEAAGRGKGHSVPHRHGKRAS